MRHQLYDYNQQLTNLYIKKNRCSHTIITSRTEKKRILCRFPFFTLLSLHLPPCTELKVQMIRPSADLPTGAKDWFAYVFFILPPFSSAGWFSIYISPTAEVSSSLNGKDLFHFLVLWLPNAQWRRMSCIEHVLVLAGSLAGFSILCTFESLFDAALAKLALEFVLAKWLGF